MKKLSAFLVSIALIYSSITSAESFDLFGSSIATDFDSLDNVGELISEQETLIAHGVYNTRIAANVANASVINLNAFDTPESFVVSNVIVMSNNRVSYVASNSQSNTMSVTEHNGDIVGSIWRNGTLYKLRTTSGGTTVLVEVKKAD